MVASCDDISELRCYSLDLSQRLTLMLCSLQTILSWPKELFANRLFSALLAIASDSSRSRKQPDHLNVL
jgi:hypothetical protein